jgi:sugar phosphate permease
VIVILALNRWGFFIGMYDLNIFAAPFDGVQAEIRGVVSGLMNFVGWLVGAGTAPVVIGYLTRTMPLGSAIASSSVICWVGAILLIFTMIFCLNRDIERSRHTHETGILPA